MVHRYSGSGTSGTLVLQYSGKLVLRYSGTTVQRYTGTCSPARWYNGTPVQRTTVQRYTGTTVQRYIRYRSPVHRYTGTPVQRYSGTPAQWYNGTSVQRYNGTAVQRCTTVPLCRCTTVPVYCAAVLCTAVPAYWRWQLQHCLMYCCTCRCAPLCLYPAVPVYHCAGHRTVVHFVPVHVSLYHCTLDLVSCYRLILYHAVPSLPPVKALYRLQGTLYCLDARQFCLAQSSPSLQL